MIASMSHLSSSFHLLSINLFGFHILSLLCPLGFVICLHFLSSFLSPDSYGEFSDAVYEHDCTAVKQDCLKLERFRNSHLQFNLLFEYVFLGLLDVKSFCNWTYCRFRDTRPSTHTASVCLSRAASKQTAWLLPSNTTNVEYLYDFYGCFSESCSRHNDYIMSNEYSW